MARRIQALAPRRVLVNDAGAIPYLSQVPPIDALGLGGFRALPFARASRFGDAAIVELIERLAPHDRPDVMAIYPGWLPGIATTFGTRIDAVRIDDNVICAADEKVIFTADWRPLDPDATGIDLGDVVDERDHDVRGHGRIVSAIHDGLWDAGRTIDGELSFVAPHDATHLRLRRTRADGGWIVSERQRVIRRGERVTLRGAPVFHVWLVGKTSAGDFTPGRAR